MIQKPFKSIKQFQNWWKLFKDGGLDIYGKQVYRIKSAKLWNRNYDSEGYLVPQFVAIDGEPHKFTKFVKI